MPWAKGQSGNPNGRPAIASHIRELAKANSLEAFETLRSLMQDAEKDSVKLAAAIAILKIAGVAMSTDGQSVTVNLPAPKRPEPDAKDRMLSLVRNASLTTAPLTDSGDSEN